MWQRTSLSIAGVVALVALAGCSRSWFGSEPRAPWRHEAEVSCLKSGSVREGAGLVRIEPINGPGMCGADFPLKVSELAATSALGFADDPRPPAGIPGSRSPTQSWPPPQRYEPASSLDARSVAPLDAPRTVNSEPGGYGQKPYGLTTNQGRYLQARSSAPMSIRAPGAGRDKDSDDEAQDKEWPRRVPAYPIGQSYPPDPGLRGQEPLEQHVPLRTTAPYTAAIGPVDVKPAATLACPIVSVLDQWIITAVQPAAQRWLGAPVSGIKQISAYSCRGMNGNPHAHISEHAFGNALDIAAFTLADGRVITVKNGWKGLPEEQGFLRDVQATACQMFNTVLAPGSNRYHYDHIHVDLMRRSSGRRICEPGAVPGDVIAARAERRYGAVARHRDPSITGSIRKPKRSKLLDRDNDDNWIEDESSEHSN